MSGWASIFNNVNSGLRMHSNTLARLQEQVATGARIYRVSDDPADAHKILDLRGQSQSLSAYLANINVVNSNLQSAYVALQNISQLLATEEGSIRAMLAGAASGIQNETVRKALAGGIESLLEHMVSMANTEILGQHMFAGSSPSVAPYEVVRDVEGRITAVNYCGGVDEMQVPVAPGVDQAANLVGNRVFTNSREEAIFLGDTGAASGTGTDSVGGDVWLSVTHSTTTYQPGSDLAEGLDAASDTILGQHTLHVDGPAGTIQLDDGPIHTFDGSETNLALDNAAGDVVHVDVTSYNMGSGGDYTVTGDGALSIDDGATTLNIDFTEQNQAVVDSRTGKILYVDSRNIARTGVEPVRVPGTYDLFGTLINVRDLLLNTRDLTEQEQRDLIAEAIGSVVEVSVGLSSRMASIGSRQQALESMSYSMEDLQASVDDQASLLEDADILQVSVDLARTQTLYEMTLATAARMLSISLLDFI